MPKSIVFLIIVVIIAVILLGLGKQISTALQAGERLDREAVEVSKLQDKNNQLKKQLEEVKTYQYWERVARDKLNLVKPGETVVIIPDESVDKVLGLYEHTVEEIKTPNWQGWLNLLFR